LYLLKKGEKIDKAEMSDDKEYFVSVGEQGKVNVLLFHPRTFFKVLLLTLIHVIKKVSDDVQNLSASFKLYIYIGINQSIKSFFCGLNCSKCFLLQNCVAVLC